MLSSTYSLPIARRLVGRYLMFGLAGVLVCISLIVTFQYFGTLTQHLAFAVAAEIGLLIVGALVLHRSVRVTQAIEHQLQQIATLSMGDNPKLQPLVDSDSTARGWNSVIEHLRNQQTISTLESRFSELCDSSDDKQWNRIFHALHEGIAVCDRGEIVVMANNAFYALLGLDPDDQVVGQHIFTLLKKHLQEAATGLTKQAEESSAPFVFEVRRAKDIAEGVFRTSRTPLLDEQCECSGTLWTIRDITQQKMAEETRNQFVFTATHELRTPLANIKAYAETLAITDDIDIRDQKNFYNIISGEATRLSRFVDELLNVNQMESGAVTLTRGETDVERMLNEVIENLKPQMIQKELQFESHFAPKLPKLFVDKDKVVAALVNLLGNAVKYTPEKGNVRFVVEVDDSVINFHVEDTGIGIAAEELPRITEKFFRSSDDRVQNIVGSGLGLAFSQEVARLHGGKITIKSELDKGSRFTLTLPIA